MRQWHRAIATIVILIALGYTAFGQEDSIGKDPCSRYSMRVITSPDNGLSKMPVVNPDGGIDYKMEIIHPCPSLTVLASSLTVVAPSPTVVVLAPQPVKPDAEKKSNGLLPRLKFALPPNGKQKTPAESLTDSLLNASPKIKPE